ncbi:MAG: hypothetical protein Q7Q71_10440 [Verrucomicrobiota bacterium JB023]|nr:hypothetical protein [Verrucomicrobiota bacterium JB023]
MRATHSHLTTSLLVAAGSALLSPLAQASTVFVFSDTDPASMADPAPAHPLDDTGIGGFMQATDSESGQLVTLTTVDIFGYSEGSFSPTAASDGAAHTLNIRNDAVAINSEFNAAFFSNEERNFQPREGWEFDFDSDVIFTSLEFESWSNGDTNARFEITSAAFAPVTILESDLSGSDFYTFESGLVVPAGTSVTITMQATSTTANENTVRIESMTVVAIPEPSIVMLGLLGLPLVCRRRRQH